MTGKKSLVTVCQLAFEAEYRVSYFAPEVAEKRAIWDAAWRESWKAFRLIYQYKFTEVKR